MFYEIYERLPACPALPILLYPQITRNGLRDGASLTARDFPAGSTRVRLPNLTPTTEAMGSPTDRWRMLRVGRRRRKDRQTDRQTEIERTSNRAAQL